jgi:hypothetical protein
MLTFLRRIGIIVTVAWRWRLYKREVMDMSSEYEPELVFEESYAPRIQRALLQVVTHGWNQAHRSVYSRFARPAAHDLLGYERRAYVEDGLHSLAKRFKLRNPEPRLNHAKNSFHVELISGQTVLTASAVAAPNEMVREALFRNTLARARQRKLFKQDEDDAPLPGSPLYGIVLYGPPEKGDQRFPGFVTVAFPDRTCSYYHRSVDLMAKFRVEYSQLVLRLRRNEGLA